LRRKGREAKQQVVLGKKGRELTQAGENENIEHSRDLGNALQLIGWELF